MSTYQVGDFDPRRILKIGVAVLTVLALFASGLFFIQRHLVNKETRLKGLEKDLVTAEVSPKEFDAFETGELNQTLKAEELARLESYGWVSREAKRVHVPIERAISIFIERSSKSELGRAGGHR